MLQTMQELHLEATVFHTEKLYESKIENVSLVISFS